MISGRSTGRRPKPTRTTLVATALVASAIWSRPASAAPAGYTSVSASSGSATVTAVFCPACGTASTAWTFTPPILSDDFHHLAWRSVDHDGNLSPVVNRTVSVDTSIPTFVSVEIAGAVTALFSKPVKCRGAKVDDFSGHGQ